MTISLKIDPNLDENDVLWRYMDVPKLISIFDQKALWLARTDAVRDRHEGRFPDEMRQLMDKAYKGFDVNNTPIKDADDFQDYLLKNTFINCWHKNPDENMVMWEVYGKTNNAVAVQTTVKNMRSNIDIKSLTGHSFLFKNVIYQNADEISGVLLYEECFFRKRRHFSFEQEVRISLDTYSTANPSKKTPNGYNLPININGLIQKILVHPDSEDWFLDAIKSITNKYDVLAPVSRGQYGTN